MNYNDFSNKLVKASNDLDILVKNFKELNISIAFILNEINLAILIGDLKFIQILFEICDENRKYRHSNDSQEKLN